MSRLPVWILALTALVVGTAPATAQESDDPAVAGGYLTLSGQYRVGAGNSHDKDITAFLGWTAPRGDAGRWMLRAEAGGGMSLYSPDAKNFGYLAGAQASIARVWTGDYLGFSDDSALELYATVGGGAFAGWSLEHSTDETDIFPTVTAGVGIRSRPTQPDATLVTFELLGEESAGDRPSRFFMRLGVGWPR